MPPLWKLQYVTIRAWLKNALDTVSMPAEVRAATVAWIAVLDTWAKIDRR